MKVKTAELNDAPLDWVVAKLKGDLKIYGKADLPEKFLRMRAAGAHRYSLDFAQGGPIIYFEDISVFRCENENLVDAKGFCTNKYRPVWGAVIGDQHCVEQSRNSYGEPCGDVYEIKADKAVTGPTPPLVAGLRCLAVSKHGAEVEVPDELFVEVPNEQPSESPNGPV